LISEVKLMDYTPITLEVAFLLEEERLGRRSLARRTGLSEMTVRLELERLQKKGLITTDRRGVTLSALGGKRFSPLLKHIKQVAEPSLHSLAQDTITLAALLSCPTARPPWWYRDLVIREGGSALILIRYRREGWRFAHNEEKVSDQNPRDERVIEGAFPLRREGDLLLIVSAPERKSAGLGLWRVITEILSETP
jgi:DNA-binding Lrp family transcriptional regulator